MERGKTSSHYQDIQTFFEKSFDKPHLNPTRNAIHTKFRALFSTGNFADLTCGKSTIDLEKAIAGQKMIIFDLAKGTVEETEGSAFGRLIVAMLQGIAMRKPTAHRVTLIIDECHNFITKSIGTIIAEAAKFTLFLIMAQQYVGQEMDPQMRDAVLNTSVQIAGRNQAKFYSSTASMMYITPEEVASLKKGDFYIHIGRRAAVQVFDPHPPAG